MRGRNGNNNNNNNRKGPNPLTRSYESNGPDVKIRGTAQQIAEKYATLARDAMSSGDRVMAENYLQHAEHYNRIIAAAQAQFAAQNPHLVREEADDEEEERDDLDAMGGVAGPHQQHQQREHQPREHRWREQRDQQEHGQQPQQQINGTGPQPVIEGTPAEIALGEESPVVRDTPARAPRVQAPRAEAVQAEAAQDQPQEREAGHVNGFSATEPAQAAEQEEGAPARRPRRPRRPRRTATQGDAGEGNVEADAAPVEG
jgi:hypothetical protein